jgi:alkanesulfonate monooxygenase SsuD/methylene tetrahydromethanopterin reductase-like flavin-dependent oxidoreductase (luciferase family)
VDCGVTFFPTIGPADKPADVYYDECLQLAERADSLGYHHVKTVEHYFFAYGGYSPDPVTFLAAMAARTTSIRVGTAAVIPAFTHPVKLAGKLAMLDNISRGRLDVGFGRGFLPDEFSAFGVSLDDSRARFIEGIEACKAMWTQEDAIWDGQFYRFGPVTLLPRPVQRPYPPIFVTSARSLESCAEAGRRGYHLLTVPGVVSTEELQERLAVYREAWLAAGHDPSTPRIHLSYPCVLAEDRDEALRLAAFDNERNSAALGLAVRAWGRTRSSQYPDYEKLADSVAKVRFEDRLAGTKLLAGTPDDVRRQLDTVLDWFGEHITVSLGVHSGHLDAAWAERSMRLFADRVMPFLPARPRPTGRIPSVAG